MPRLVECEAIGALKRALTVLPGVRCDTLVDVRPASRHTSGLAIDIFFNSKNPVQKARALELIAVLVKHQKPMQWSDLIFTNFHIGGGIGGYMGDGKTKSPWTKGGHDDHIHLDWVDRTLPSGKEGSEAFMRNPWEHSEVSKKTGWTGALQPDLQELARSWAAGPVATPQWVKGWWTVTDGSTYYYYFSDEGLVGYTKTRPGNARVAPPRKPLNEGKVTITPQGLVIDWNPADGGATRETFTKRSDAEMAGTSNRYGPLNAKKLA